MSGPGQVLAKFNILYEACVLVVERERVDVFFNVLINMDMSLKLS